MQRVFYYIKNKLNIIPNDQLITTIDNLSTDQCKQLTNYVIGRIRLFVKKNKSKLPESNESVIIPDGLIIHDEPYTYVPFKDTLVDHIWSIDAEPGVMPTVIKPIARLACS